MRGVAAIKNPFAFPCSASDESGMTLRDWFAGEVLKHIWISATQNAEEEEYNLGTDILGTPRMKTT